MEFGWILLDVAKWSSGCLIFRRKRFFSNEQSRRDDANIEKTKLESDTEGWTTILLSDA